MWAHTTPVKLTLNIPMDILVCVCVCEESSLPRLVNAIFGYKQK